MIILTADFSFHNNNRFFGSTILQNAVFQEQLIYSETATGEVFLMEH